MGFAFEWEIQLIVWLQSFSNGFTDALATLFTICAEDYMIIMVLGIVYWCLDKEMGRRVTLSLSGSILFGSLLKALVMRRRPYMDYSEVQCIRAAHPDEDIMSVEEQGYSFPSLHAAMSASAYSSIAENTRKKWAIALAVVLPLLIGLSRPFLGVHYPTDVLVGWLLGIVSTFVFGAIEKKLGYFKSFSLLLIIGASGFFYCTDSEFFSGYGVVLGALLGFWIEEKFVHFTYCHKWWSYIVRPLLGLLIFILLKAALEYPVRFIALAETSTPILLYRAVRYTICTAVTLGVYPVLFRVCKNHF